MPCAAALLALMEAPLVTSPSRDTTPPVMLASKDAMNFSVTRVRFTTCGAASKWD